MKKVTIICVLAIILCLAGCKKNDAILPGSIYGTITDKATGELIKTAGVELSPLGLKTVTGSNGMFEFPEVDEGKYNLIVSKVKYQDFISSSIKVDAGKKTQADVQLEKLPDALSVTDDKSQSIDDLDFGAEESDVIRSFNIFNDGAEELEWQITSTAQWIDNISKVEGKVKAGAVQPIVLRINRDKLAEGMNKTTIQITSSSGTKQLAISATNNRVGIQLNTLETTNITASSAKFHAEIINQGNPKYTERGFVYGLNTMPMLENSISIITVAVTDIRTFDAEVNGLSVDKTYYVRAYAKNALGVVYSTNQITFTANASLPQVTTSQVSNINIAEGTAKFTGVVNSVGDPIYNEKGFVYGPNPNPTIDDMKKVVSGIEPGEYSANVFDLIEGKTYYVRAFATNVKGTTYGSDVIFSTNASMPQVLTSPCSNINIGAGAVTFSGKVTSLGDLGYKEKGFVYGVNHNPTIDETKLIVSGTEAGEFNLNVSGIPEGYLYYVRAYVTNQKGTVYGDEMNFVFIADQASVTTNEVTDINRSAGTATFHATINSAGDLSYIERGFVYAKVHNPSMGDFKVVSEGAGTGAYSSKVDELELGQIYYIRAFVTSTKETVYGNEVTADFSAVMPNVVTLEASNLSVDNGTATFNGEINDKGDPVYTRKGFVYGLTSYPTIDNSVKLVAGTNLGTFSAHITNLQLDNNYYVRAFAESSEGVVYGEQITFTLATKVPVVVTNNITNISVADGSAILNGEITSIGEPAYTERGFVYSTSHSPIMEDSKVQVSGRGLGQYAHKLTNLLKNQIYYVRAYALNAKGVSYGQEIKLDMTVIPPTIATKDVSNITALSAIGEIVVTVGNLPIESCGICWSTNPYPTVENNKAIASSIQLNTSYLFNLNELKPSTTYYVRGFATTDVTTTYSDQKTFITRNGNASVSAGSITNITTLTATGSVTVTDAGGATLQQCGICWSTNPVPTIADSKSTAGGVECNTPYSCNMSNLLAGKTYYVRAYATTNVATSYSVVKTFTTLCNVSGVIKNESNQVIPNANVVFKQNNVVVKSVTSNSNGNISLQLTPGTYSTEVTATGYVKLTKEVYVDNNPISLVMRQLGVLVGTIYDDDNIPLSNANLSVKSSDKTVLYAVSGSDGTYRIENISLGETLSITCSRSGYSLTSNIPNRNISSGENSLDIQMSINNPSECDLYTTIFECTNAGLCGTTATRTFTLKNNRQKAVSWSLSGVPAKGLKFTPSSGTIAANSSVIVTATFTYPGPSVPGSVKTSLSYCYIGNKRWTSSYLWGWSKSGFLNSDCNTWCEQEVTAIVGNNSHKMRFSLYQIVVWDN